MKSSPAQIVKKIRNALCMQQAEFGKLLEVSGQAVINYENGKRVPKRPVLRKLKKLAEENNIEFNLEDFLGE